ncbi:MAG: NAD-dependent epimerase/dehydratase family protein [Microbacterium sp.]|jgi:GDP-4-dehydro-6-deoxy-D-mannose reductase|uniref:NAD-dependent epimerase/dehydratase family protein n=1 Tax=Microbacterium sp. TaxID=51671 RepID=UPI002838D034|nr:NAD-dependent epimerase/dehydratase family protein [Microbacterium sp.]MDR2323365.1 NAD-dependent epimerase/dehydratase family protein [Microbacterium sp.]
MTTVQKRSIVVTGASGFVGRHVIADALDRGYDVHAVMHADVSWPGRERLTSWHIADLREDWPDGLTADAAIHLAGLAAVGPSFAHPQRYITANSAMMTAVGEAAIAGAIRGRVVVVSTGGVYAGGGAVPLTEDSPLAASSPYAVSKILVEQQADYYRRRGVDAIVARPFNHIGPGQAPGFLVPDLRAALDALPADAPLAVGNLTTRRDYTDVRDIAHAYLDLIDATTLRNTTYNVSTGRSLSGAEILALLCETMGRDIPSLVADPDRWRPTDLPEVIGSSRRLHDELGWSPRRTPLTAIADFVKGLDTESA